MLRDVLSAYSDGGIMSGAKSFLSSSLFMGCVALAAFLLLVWPFPTAFIRNVPEYLCLYLFIAWGGCIGAVFLWALCSKEESRESSSVMRLRASRGGRKDI